MLCSNAIRLAQAAGLHREQSTPREMGNVPAGHGNRIWWALYCFEKLISMRDGCPSCINDDEYVHSLLFEIARLCSLLTYMYGAFRALSRNADKMKTSRASKALSSLSNTLKYRPKFTTDCTLQLHAKDPKITAGEPSKKSLIKLYATGEGSYRHTCGLGCQLDTRPPPTPCTETTSSIRIIHFTQVSLLYITTSLGPLFTNNHNKIPQCHSTLLKVRRRY